MSSFKYKSSFINNLTNNGAKNGVKIAVPLKCLNNFWRSLEIPLINCKVKFSSTWNENCILSDSNRNSIFKIKNAILYVPVVTLTMEDNSKLTKLFSKRI